MNRNDLERFIESSAPNNNIVFILNQTLLREYQQSLILLFTFVLYKKFHNLANPLFVVFCIACRIFACIGSQLAC